MVTSSSSGYILWRQQAPAQLHQLPAPAVPDRLPTSSSSGSDFNSADRSSSTDFIRFRLHETLNCLRTGCVMSVNWELWEATIACCALSGCAIHISCFPFTGAFTELYLNCIAIDAIDLHLLCCYMTLLRMFVMPTRVPTGWDPTKDTRGHDVR